MAKKMGRPFKGATRRTAPLAFRVNPALKEEMQKAAKAEGHSLSDEIEWRLAYAARLAKKVTQIKDDFGGEFFAAMWMVRSALAEFEKEAGKKWYEDSWLCWIAAQIAQAIFSMLGPDEEIKRPEHLFEPEFPDTNPDGPRLYRGVVDEVDAAPASAAYMFRRIMETPKYEWLDTLSKRDREEWELLADKEVQFDLWIRKTLGPLGDKLAERYAPFSLTPERLKRKLAAQREKRIDPEGYRKRIEEAAERAMRDLPKVPTKPPEQGE